MTRGLQFTSAGTHLPYPSSFKTLKIHFLFHSDRDTIFEAQDKY